MNAISGGRTVAAPWRLGWVALCLLATATGAAADVSVRGRMSGTIGGEGRPGQGINLHIERTDLAVAYDDGSGGDRLEVGRIGIAWFETPAPGIRLGASLGRQGISQNDRATTAGLDPDGYFVTFDAAGRWAMGRHLRFGLGGRLAYSEASDGSDPDGVDIDWWSATLRPAATIRLGDRLRLHAGIRAQWLDGDERTTGGSRATTGFHEDGVAGGFVGIGLDTGRGGRIRLRADTGPVRGLHLAFERRY